MKDYRCGKCRRGIDAAPEWRDGQWKYTLPGKCPYCGVILSGVKEESSRGIDSSFWGPVFRNAPVPGEFMALGGILAVGLCWYFFADGENLFSLGNICILPAAAVGGLFLGLLVGVAVDGIDKLSRQEPNGPVGPRSLLLGLAYLGVLVFCLSLLCGGIGVGYYMMTRETDRIPVVFNADGAFRHNNSLSLQDPRNKFKKPHKTYLVAMEAEKEYQINLNSAEFDAYLYLVDPEGRIVAENDDRNHGDLNSVIFHRPKVTGTYRIEATSNRGDQAGSFSLAVKRK